MNVGGLPVGLNKCRDLGMDCSFRATETADTNNMNACIDHAASVHKMQVLSAEVILKVQNAIKR